MSLPKPSFYRPKQVRELYVERASKVAEEAESFREKHQISSASRDSVRIAAFGIDCQVGFCHPSASLFVPGAAEDTLRTINWLYTNLDKITELFFSLDTHRVYQIFHAAWWVDSEGNPPPPLTQISYEDVLSERWKPRFRHKLSREYCRLLEERGRYQLTIWPYHTLLGGLSHALVPALMEAAMFHSLVRKTQTNFEMKGQSLLTENYSVLSPEVEQINSRKVGRFNQMFFNKLMSYDRIYVFGQAKSHCVLSTLQDMLEQIKVIDKKLLKKVWILEDAMSPVPAPPLDPLPAALDFPRIADEAIERFRSEGMTVVSTKQRVKI